MNDQSSENPDREITGAYEGSTLNMVPVEPKNGQTRLKCLNCGVRVSKNYGNAKDHCCGDGADGSPYRCCESPNFEDVWLERESSESRTSKERMKECKSCGERLSLQQWRPVDAKPNI